MKYILIGVSTKYTNEMSVNSLVGMLSLKVKIERANLGWGDGMCILVLESKTRFDKLKQSVFEIMTKECPMFFFFKHDSKTSLTSLPDNYQHILDLDKHVSVDFSVKSDLNFILKALSEVENVKFFDLLDDSCGEGNYLPTIDELLDKICESGYESLSLHEKSALENYSKKLN